MYLHHVSELLLKIHHTSDMSQISVEGVNHYTIVYCHNCIKLKDSVVRHCSAHWKSLEDCFTDICTSGVCYERAKGYCRADFDTPGASAINEVKSTKDPGLYIRCSGPHSQSRCTKHRYQSNNKSQSTSST